MNFFCTGIIAFAFVNFVSPQSESTPEPVNTTSQVDFSWNAYKKTFSKYKENFVMSPYSLRRLFSCLQGVKLLSPTANPKLQQELSKVLELKPNDQPSEQAHRSYVAQWLRLAEAKNLNMTTMVVAIGRQKASQAFDSIIENCVIYTGYLQPSTSKLMGQIINNALENITHHSVKDFLTETDINKNWKFFAVDSWQFKGLWKYKFQKEFTATCNFFESKDKKALTNFMYLEENLKYGHFPQWKVQAVELPYDDQSPLSCVLLMPVGTSIDALISGLNHTWFKQIYSKMVPSRTTVRLPQFGLRTTVPGRQLLEEMGLNVPFNNGVFQVFERGQKVLLGEIVQKVELEMGYEGQETAQRFVDKRSDKQFTAQQPFVFVIFDRTDLVPVLMGQYLKVPENASSEKEDKQHCEGPPNPSSFL
ncbi:serpin B5-like [Ochlerotatus camptorhynchus]|uniref:serpin B5-like n=1 Tax=Ochlerotatus camptorhynchus TaxID=644619 RepID=UPI0031E07AC3